MWSLEPGTPAEEHRSEKVPARWPGVPRGGRAEPASRAAGQRRLSGVVAFVAGGAARWAPA